MMVSVGRTDDAVAWLHEEAAVDCHNAGPVLVDQLVALGRTTDAVRWLTAGSFEQAHIANSDSVGPVADLLEADGRPEAALTWLQEWAEGGDEPALARLVGILHARGEVDRAHAWLLRPPTPRRRPMRPGRCAGWRSCWPLRADR
jgi:hypothetical protein